MKTLFFILIGISPCTIIVAVAQTPAGNAAREKAMMQFLMGPSFSEADYQLTLAVAHRDDVQAEAALKNGANPNFLDLGNGTQLMLACQNGDVKTAEVLLKHGAKPDLMDADGYTALMMACQFFMPEMVRVLLKHGANPNLKADGDVAKSMGTQGYTALMIGCRSSSFETVQGLLDHGADPRCVGADGRTALDIVKQRSGWREQQPVIELLEQK
ncbi:MAG: ankyrin repeat domain-containing protein [Methylacidiphilales bacterium]|nr:ankyrin repeat domain-containing protein [Candidatus Methylacidiphilales bacterium]